MVTGPLRNALNSLCAVLLIGAVVALLLRRPVVTGLCLVGLGSGALGVLWADVTTRAGARLRLSALSHHLTLTPTERRFLLTHAAALPVGTAIVLHACEGGRR